jgi:hypothetical protein
MPESWIPENIERRQFIVQHAESRMEIKYKPPVLG